jgi:hypothetical protein
MAWLLVSGGLTYVGAAAVTTSDRTTPASFAGFATGSSLHADAIQAALVGPRIADVDEAFAGATVNTAGLPGTMANEFGESIQPDDVTGKQAAARGSGLEVGLATDLPAGVNDPNTHQVLLAGQADATARPDTPTVTKQIGPVNLDPIAFASLLTGQAQAQFGDLLGRCPSLPLVNPFSRGRGDAADVQLINAGTGSPAGFSVPVVSTDTPGQTVTFSEAKTFPIDNGDGTFGLVSEVRQRLVPVKVANQLLITVLGEVVLRATVTGKPGGSKIEYSPPTGGTNLVLIQQLGVGNIPIPGAPILQLTLQQLLGAGGLVLPANPLVNLAVGEAPRARFGVSGTPVTDSAHGSDTKAEAAVDVLRLQVLPGVAHLTDIRLGHMEVSAQVPAGGFSFNDCGVLKVTKNTIGAVSGPFVFHVSCPGLSPSDALLPTESDFTLAAGATKSISLPTGTQCTVTEPGKGTATTTVVSETGSPAATGADTTNGVVTIPAGMIAVIVGFTNQSNGQLQVIKSSQAGLVGPYAFSAACTPAAPAVPATFTLLPNDSKTFGPITGGTTCTVTETDKGDSSVTRVVDSTAPNNDGSVLIAGAGTQTVSFSNAGPPLVISKTATGASAGKGPFTFHLDCKDPAGVTVALSAADSDFTLAGGQSKQLKTDMPDGSTCVVTETNNGGATTTIATDTVGASNDRTVTVTHGQTQAVNFTNNFDPPIKLVITKTVVGTGTGPFTFHLQCFPSVAGGTPLVLPAGDADFTLSAGQSKSIANLPNNALCVVTETDARGAARTFQESSGTPNDGAVIIPVSGAAQVGVTNTFPTPIVEPTVNASVIPALPVAPVVVAPRTVG